MRSELPKWSDSSVSECESTATFESGLGTSYDTSLVKPVEVSYVLVGSEHDNIRCNSQETGSRIKRMLLFFRQKYANTAVPPIVPASLLPSIPPETYHHHYQLPLHHLHHQLPTSCPSLMVGNPAMAQIPAVSCGAQQIIACDLGSTDQREAVSTEVWRPSKKRRLIQRRRESKLFGVEARLEDLGVGPDGEKLRRRNKEMKRKEETLEQKLKRKLNHPSLRPWHRAAMAEIYPSSSEDETCGWIPPGEYMRSLFDMPEQAMTRDTRADNEEKGKPDNLKSSDDSSKET